MTTAAKAATYPDPLREEVESYLQQIRFAEREPAAAGLEEAMRYSLLAGGKRIRPVLALATARAIGRDPVEVLPFAAGLAAQAAAELERRARAAATEPLPGQDTLL